MLIRGGNLHTRDQQIAMANCETGDLLLQRRSDDESRKGGPDVNPNRHRVAFGAPLRR
jgi:hypothetical protein